MREHAKKDDTPIELSEHQSLREATVPVGRRCTTCGLDLPANVNVCPQDGTRLLGPLSEDAVLKSKYEFLSMVGSGGMGAIYKARQRLLNKLVAIKVMHSHLMTEEAMRRFQLEGRATSQLKHQGIVSVLDFGVTDAGQPFMVMDFVEGQTLASVIKEGPLNPARFLKIFIQVCEALEAAHNKSILHRDVKPGNIMLAHNDRGEEEVRVMDFGIAKLMSDTESGAQNLTRTGEAIGSPLYMSPEQCRCSAVDQRSDIYSLGCVMYEALAGTPPFLGNSTVATLMMHVNDEPPPMSEASLGVEVDPKLQRIVLSALNKNPHERPNSMRELGDQLRSVQRELEAGNPSKEVIPPTSTATGTQQHAVPKGFSWKLAVPALVVVLAVGIYAIANHRAPGRSSPQTANSTKEQTPDSSDQTSALASKQRGENYEGTIEEGIKAIVRSNAHRVDLSNSEDFHDLSDNDLRYLAEDSKLEYLTIRRANVTDAGLEYLKDKPLIELDLSRCAVKDLGPLRNCTSIRRLELAGTQLSTKGMEVIATMPNLQYLNLADTPISNSDLQLLSSLQKLQELNVSDCLNVTKQGIEKLMRRLGNHCIVRSYVQAQLAEARNFAKEQNYAAAERILQRILQTTYDLSPSAKEAALLALGDSQVHLNKFDAAIKTFEQSVANCKLMHSPDGELGSKFWIAALLEQKYLQSKNMKDLNKAAEIRENEKKSTEKYPVLMIDNAIRLSCDYKTMGDVVRAEKLLEETMPAAEQHSHLNPRGVTDCAAQLGNIASDSGHYLAAIDYFEKALRYGDSVPEESLTVAAVRFRMADALLKSKQFEQAKTVATEGLKRQAPDDLHRGFYSMLYTVAQKQNDSKEMERLSAELGKLNQKLGQPQ